MPKSLQRDVLYQSNSSMKDVLGLEAATASTVKAVSTECIRNAVGSTEHEIFPTHKH